MNVFPSFDGSRLNEPNWSGFQGGAPQLQWGPPSQYSPSSVNGALIGSNNAHHSNPHQRVVVINRDDRGFGFVVAGDNPVFVQTVREGKRNRFRQESFPCSTDWAQVCVDASYRWRSFRLYLYSFFFFGLSILSSSSVSFSLHFRMVFKYLILLSNGLPFFVFLISFSFFCLIPPFLCS